MIRYAFPPNPRMRGKSHVMPSFQILALREKSHAMPSLQILACEEKATLCLPSKSSHARKKLRYAFPPNPRMRGKTYVMPSLQILACEEKATSTTEGGTGPECKAECMWMGLMAV